MPVQCPKCGSRYLRNSKMKEAGEKIRRWCFEEALRCVDCKTRFIASTFILSDVMSAHCPMCRRTDLNAWSGKTYEPVGWTAVKVALGAHKWRCEYCRLNFASFGKRLEIFSFRRWEKLNVGSAVADGRSRLAELEKQHALLRELAEKKAREKAALITEPDDEE